MIITTLIPIINDMLCGMLLNPAKKTILGASRALQFRPCFIRLELFRTGRLLALEQRDRTLAKRSVSCPNTTSRPINCKLYRTDGSTGTIISRYYACTELANRLLVLSLAFRRANGSYAWRARSFNKEV